MVSGILGMFLGATGGPDPTVHVRGQTSNYATPSYQRNRDQALHLQDARGPGGTTSNRGWNSAAYRTGLAYQDSLGGIGSSMMIPTTSPYTRKTYPLGKPSDAFWKKFAKWGDQGPQGNTGWASILTKAPPSQSTSAPTQKFDQEVFQTRETRNASGIQPFQVLGQHTQTSRLNPNLAYMYKEKNTQLGAVRKTVTRFF